MDGAPDEVPEAEALDPRGQRLGIVIGDRDTGESVLVAALGYARTTLLGAALNVTVGLAALALSGKLDAARVPSSGEDSTQSPLKERAGPLPRVALTVAAAFS